MSDTEDDEFTKAFEGFGKDDTKDKLSTEKPDEATDKPSNPDPAGAEAGKSTETKEEPKTQETKDTEGTDKQKTEETKPIEAPATETPVETPSVVETPQPLTKEDVTAIISNLRNEERNSGKELEDTTQDVLEKFYPDGLSNVLVDEKSGKELKVPSDVVEASGGQMTTEEAAQWLMNEQFKLDKQVNEIKNQAKAIAETTVRFKRDSVAVIAKYEPLFKKFPHLQQKVYDKLMKQVKIDKEKGVVLSAPDVMEHYDDYLEPYQQAFEFSTNQPATAPVTPAAPEVAKPTAEDRMDISGDGGPSPVDDPNDFAQQIKKELAKGF